MKTVGSGEAEPSPHIGRQSRSQEFSDTELTTLLSRHAEVTPRDLNHSRRETSLKTHGLIIPLTATNRSL